jgi:hypothetical protein
LATRRRESLAYKSDLRQHAVLKHSLDDRELPQTRYS